MESETNAIPDPVASSPAATAEIPATPPETSPAAVAPEPPFLPRRPEPARFRFHGSAAEYFRIWIVNTLLTVVTLGVFSAWAKVRKRRYLRGNTELLGQRFDYTADPRRILIGNFLVIVLFLAYALFGAVYPAVRVIALGLVVLLLPWIVVRSLCFNAHHTMWRGLRFRFHPSLSAGVMTYLFQPVLIGCTLGLYYPAWVRARTEFTISRHRLGTAYFHFEAKNNHFYRTYLAAGGMMFIALLVVGIFSNAWIERHAGHVPTTVQLLPALLFYGVMLYVTKQFIFAQLFNHIWSGTRLDDSHLRGRLSSRRWLGLQLTNLGAIVISFGLLYPWALIRSTRYAIESLEILPSASLEKIERVGGKDGSAVGDTAAEFAGLDFGL